MRELVRRRLRSPLLRRQDPSVRIRSICILVFCRVVARAGVAFCRCMCENYCRRRQRRRRTQWKFAFLYSGKAIKREPIPVRERERVIVARGKLWEHAPSLALTLTVHIRKYIFACAALHNKYIKYSKKVNIIKKKNQRKFKCVTLFSCDSSS